MKFVKIISILVISFALSACVVQKDMMVKVLELITL